MRALGYFCVGWTLLSCSPAPISDRSAPSAHDTAGASGAGIASGGSTGEDLGRAGSSVQGSGGFSMSDAAPMEPVADATAMGDAAVLGEAPVPQRRLHRARPRRKRQPLRYRTAARRTEPLGSLQHVPRPVDRLVYAGWNPNPNTYISSSVDLIHWTPPRLLAQSMNAGKEAWYPVIIGSGGDTVSGQAAHLYYADTIGSGGARKFIGRTITFQRND